jgi:hypothetical protein
MTSKSCVREMFTFTFVSLISLLQAYCYCMLYTFLYLSNFSLKLSTFLSHSLKFIFIFRSTSLSAVGGSPSVYHFSSHMGQLMRHSADTIGGSIQGCSMLWPNCPYSSEKLMRISTKVRLR